MARQQRKEKRIELMTRVALYARHSSDNQRDASVEDQLRQCRERATREGWTVVETYSDRAISGASLIRSGIQSLLADAQEPRWHPKPHRQALERHHNQGQPHHQFRHPQLRALCRCHPLEPAEEAEEPRHWPLRLSAQSRKRMDTLGGSRASHCVAGTMGCGQGAAG